MEEYAIVQVMHQTVREFFLGPYDAVSRSPFKVVANVQQARIMIGTTCVRYLNLHHQEVMNKFQHLASDWKVEDFYKFVRYLNSRPFIKYSLEFFLQPNNNGDQEIQQLLSDLTKSLRNCPPSAAFCLLKRLVKSNTDADNVQRQVNHLLIVAAEEGCVVAVGNLLAAGADCGSIDKHKCTPLHSAAANGHKPTVRLLFDSGADKEANDVEGRTAVHHAASNGHDSSVELLVKTLGADTEAKDGKKWTALHHAASNGHDSTVELLVKTLGAAKEATDDKGRTALHHAASNGHDSTVLLLTTLSADKVAKDNEGRTAVYHAAKNGHDSAVRLLVETLGVAREA
jgi:ankyrin repeat protein